MQKEWFKVSSHKASSSAHVESYLKMVENVKEDLRTKIVNMEDANVSADTCWNLSALKWRIYCSETSLYLIFRAIALDCRVM